MTISDIVLAVFVCICMYVCIYVYMYVCMCVYIVCTLYDFYFVCLFIIDKLPLWDIKAFYYDYKANINQVCVCQAGERAGSGAPRGDLLMKPRCRLMTLCHASRKIVTLSGKTKSFHSK